MLITYNYRIKDSTTKKHLSKLASWVNFVWNYCNQTSFDALRNQSKWLTSFDLNNLMSGSSKEIPLHSQTFQRVSKEYTDRRKQYKKRKLRWRSFRKSLGWIPFTSSGVRLQGSEIVYKGLHLKFWKSRDIAGTFKVGNFSQDARGRWYVNLTCEISEMPLKTEGIEVGIDLGLKDKISLSNGDKVTRENLTIRYSEKLAKAQRAKKPRIVKTIYAKIKNKRKDWNHKESRKLVDRCKRIVIGNLKLPKTTRLAKSIYDSSFGDLTNQLQYKAIKHGVSLKIVNEKYSTVTCSVCCSRSGPSGLSALRVREWKCGICSAVHDRDTNAAINILRFGTESP